MLSLITKTLMNGTVLLCAICRVRKEKGFLMYYADVRILRESFRRRGTAVSTRSVLTDPSWSVATAFHTAAASNRKKSPKPPDSSRPCRLMKRQGRLLLGRLLEKLFYEAYRILFARCKSFKLVDPGSGHKIGGQEISFCGSRSDDEVC